MDAAQASPANLDAAPDAAGPYQEDRILCYFWLPSGKDEFGFKALAEAPLYHTMRYRTESKDRSELTFAAHMTDVLDRLPKQYNAIGGVVSNGNLEVIDSAELGLRKIHHNFTYRYHGGDRETVKPGPYQGTEMFLSNGLFLWSFSIERQRSASAKELSDWAASFINDFFANYISVLFDFAWPRSVEGADAKEGKGVLTYYQKEILFNGLFDAAAHPADFFGRPEEDRPEYTIGEIVRSVALFSIAGVHDALSDKRKDYGRTRVSTGQALPDIDVDLDDKIIHRSPHLVTTNKELDPYDKREELLSRLTYAAMEQFLRVSIPFGIAHYRAGLDHCRTDLVNARLLTRRDHPSSELRRRSLADLLEHGDGLPVTDIEAYYTLLAGKLPLIEYVGGLVEGLGNSSRPFNAPSGDVEPGSPYAHWGESRANLREAQAQYQRQVSAIRADLISLSGNLTLIQADLTLDELAENRKLSEIEAENPMRSMSVDLRDWNQLGYRIAIVGTGIALATAYGAFGTVFTDAVLHGEAWPNDIGTGLLAYGHWIVALALIVGISMLVYRRIERAAATSNAGLESHGPGFLRRTSRIPRGEQDTHVFDYSVQREQVVGCTVDEYVRNLRSGQMLSLDGAHHNLVASHVNTFREGTAGSTERVKYSLQAAEHIPSGTSYLLHVEIDCAERKEYLRDVRLVVRVPAGGAINIVRGARLIIGTCIADLVTGNMTEEKRRDFFRSRLGWEWPLPGS